MVVQNFDVIDVITKKKGITIFVMVEWRKWKDNKNIHSLMFSQLILKALNYIKYSNSEEFRSKYKNSDAGIVYHTVDKSPKEVCKYMKENKIKITIGD